MGERHYPSSQTHLDDAVVPQPSLTDYLRQRIPHTLVHFKDPRNGHSLATFIEESVRSEADLGAAIGLLQWLMVGWRVKDIARVLDQISGLSETCEALLIVGLTTSWSSTHIAELVILLFNRQLLPGSRHPRRNPRILLAHWSESILQEIISSSKIVMARLELEIRSRIKDDS